MAEYLARVSWQKIRDYKEALVRKGRSSGVSLVNQYGSNQPALEKLRYNDGLWLFTAPVIGRGKNRRTLPPSVLGRIDVSHYWPHEAGRPIPAPGAPLSLSDHPYPTLLDVSSSYKSWVGGKPGTSLPIHNAYPLFRSLTFKGRVKKVNFNPSASRVPSRGPFGRLMQHFQSIRALTGTAAASLRLLQDHVTAGRTVFLAHRQVDAGDLVARVARDLQENALSWWDVQSVPQSLEYTDQMLGDLLYDGIRQAKVVIVFLTPGYGDANSWARRELDLALQIKAESRPDLAIIPLLLGGPKLEGLSFTDPIDAGDKPSARAVAKVIREFLTT